MDGVFRHIGWRSPGIWLWKILSNAERRLEFSNSPAPHRQPAPRPGAVEAACPAYRVIILCGPFRSGSTWLFNCVQELACLTGRPFHASYTNRITDEIEKAYASGKLVIVKTHHPATEMIKAAQDWDALFIITTRDPRDCVTSLILQFQHGFYRALVDIKRSCDAALGLHKTSCPIVLRYEDRFTDDARTLELLSRETGLGANPAQRAKIFESLRPQAVTKTIDSYIRSGVFDGSVPALQFHAKTQWHPNHIGDGSSKKYKKNLKFWEHYLIMSTNLRFFLRFKYTIN